MNTAPRPWRAMLTLGIVLACCPCASALDPSLDVSQYAHTTWKARDGFAKGAIFSIAQTTDGYLWLGTEFGLFRFDGVRAVPWQPPSGEQLPDNFINQLLVSRDGALWIGTHKGLARWKDGRFTKYPELAGLAIFALLENREGTVWVGAHGLSAGNFCAAKGVTLRCYGSEQFGPGVSALYEDHKGNLWVSAVTGLWRWAPGPPEHFTFPRGVVAADSLIEDDSGALLMSTRMGLKQLVDGKIESYSLPGVTGDIWTDRFLRSSDSSLWVTTQQGLLHLHQGRVDGFRAIDGLSADFVTPIFEDREGNVWVGTQDGLDQFREVAVPTISRPQGLSNSAAWSVQASPDGSVWIGTADGLNRWENGHMTVYRSQKPQDQNSQRDERGLSANRHASEIANSGLTGNMQSLGQDDRGRLWASTSEGVFYLAGGRFTRIPGVPGGVTFSIAGGANGGVWISNWEHGLFYWTEGSAVQRIPMSRFGEKRAVALMPDRVQGGGLWLGFYEGGIAHLKDGQVRASYNTTDGLGNGKVNGLWFGSRGELWAATEGGLSSIEDGHIATLTSKNGLPCDAVHWSVEDDDHAVWLYMPCGLVRIARSELDGWLSDPKHTIQTTVFDISDGARSPAIAGGYPPTVTKSPDGRIWFLPRDGVSVVDPHHLPINNLPPPVHVEQITADQNVYWQNSAGDASTNLHLPAQVRDLQIDYTALSYVAPEKVHFRYKLEGWDRDWQWVGNRRQAFYTNLSPGDYRFRVSASNNSGVWNEAGTSFAFSIAPAYYQTTWFRLTCVAAFLAMLWGLYQRRLRQATQHVQHRMQGRLMERERIARELHDTLLQSVQGLILKFDAVAKQIPRDEPARLAMDDALDRADEVMGEGRERVRSLRAGASALNDLPAAFQRVADETATGSEATFKTIVEGSVRELNPMVLEESYSIGREALINALAHSGGLHVEVEIMYDPRQFRLRVRDDGRGVDPRILENGGRPGHWGMQGMRERAQGMGAQLGLWSRPGSGTEVELSVPAATAYTSGRTPTKTSWLGRVSGNGR